MKRVTTKTSANAVHLAPTDRRVAGHRHTRAAPRRPARPVDADRRLRQPRRQLQRGDCRHLRLGQVAVAQRDRRAYLGTGARVWIIDVGRSYEKACRNFGGSFIEFTEDAGLSLNPFSLGGRHRRGHGAAAAAARADGLAAGTTGRFPVLDAGRGHQEGLEVPRVPIDMTVTDIHDLLATGAARRRHLTFTSQPRATGA